MFFYVKLVLILLYLQIDMKNTTESSAKKEVVVFSLDYDNSAGTLLSDGNHSALMKDYEWVIDHLMTKVTTPAELKNRMMAFVGNKTSAAYHRLGQTLIREIKSEFLALYHDIKADKETVLMVGSNRQSPVIDVFNSYSHQNMLCHEVYRDFAMAQGIQFSELLLPDVFDADGQPLPEPLPVGTTMNADKIEFTYLEKRDALLERLHTYPKSPDFKDHKKCLLKTQLQHIATQYPEDQYRVYYVFIDDNREIIEQTEKARRDGELFRASHIRCKIIQFDLTQKFYEKILHRFEVGLQSVGTKRKLEESVSAVSVFSAGRVFDESQSSSNKMFKK